MRIVFAVVFALLALVVSPVSAQETRPASWDIVVSGSPDISIPLISVEHSNGPTTRVASPAGSSYEVTFLRDLGGNRSEYGVMLGSSNGYGTVQGHWFNPFVTKGAFQLGTTVGAGIGMQRDGLRLNAPGLAFRGDLTAALKAPHGIMKVSAGLDSRDVFAIRIGFGIGI